MPLVFQYLFYDAIDIFYMKHHEPILTDGSYYFDADIFSQIFC